MSLWRFWQRSKCNKGRIRCKSIRSSYTELLGLDTHSMSWNCEKNLKFLFLNMHAGIRLVHPIQNLDAQFMFIGALISVQGIGPVWAGLC